MHLTPSGIPAGEMTVVEVIAGEGVKVGERINVDFNLHRAVRPIDQKLPVVMEWLLFISIRDVNGLPIRYSVVHSGIRCRTDDGRILLPRQIVNPGDYLLCERYPNEFPATWQGTLDQVRGDFVQVKRLRQIRRQNDDTRRNRELLAWIEKHRPEFGGVSSSLSTGPHGWGDLEYKLFEEIATSADLDTAWEAATLSQAIDRDVRRRAFQPIVSVAPVLYSSSAFTSPEGRAFLLNVCPDPICQRATVCLRWKHYATVFHGPTHSGPTVNSGRPMSFGR